VSGPADARRRGGARRLSPVLAAASVLLAGVALVACGGGASASNPSREGARTTATATATSTPGTRGGADRPAHCVRLWNTRPFGEPGERRLIGAQRTAADGRPFPALVTRSRRGLCLVVFPDTQSGIDTYSFERGAWGDFIVPGHKAGSGDPRARGHERVGWEVAYRAILEEELEPLAETEPNAVVRPDGRLVITRPGQAPIPTEVGGTTEARHFCGTTADTPAGEASPAQEVVSRISCERGLTIMREWWKAGGKGHGKIPSGFRCESSPSTTTERCASGPRSVELNYGI
jgi:hypothetical protein